MPLPCSVCAHLRRADIDRRLAFQVVNVSALAREYGLGKDAVRTHRNKHLPQFLPAFQARADALSLTQLQAEAQRLYTVTLDALAQAEAGTLAAVDEDGREHRKVSSTAVARLIREARAGLGLLANLAADGPADESGSATANTELDQRIKDALDRAASRALTAAPPSDIIDVEPIDEGSTPAAGGDADRGSVRTTPGPGAGRAGGQAAGQESPPTLTHPPVDAGPEDSPLTPTEAELLRLRLIVVARAGRHRNLNAATTLEELRALGYDVSALPVAGTVADGPVVPPVHRRT